MLDAKLRRAGFRIKFVLTPLTSLSSNTMENSCRIRIRAQLGMAHCVLPECELGARPG